MRLKRLPIALLLTCVAPLLVAQPPGIAPVYGDFGPGLLDYQGVLGTAKIGLTLVIDQSFKPHGSYFYFNNLKDIPIKGSFERDGFKLQEYDSAGNRRGAFLLRISTQGLKKIERPLTLGNTFVLSGTWTSSDGMRKLPVELKQEDWVGGREGNRYGAFGSEASVEHKIRMFYAAVQMGDRQTAAEWIHYPLRANSLLVRNKRQFLARYNQIFPANFVHCVANYPPHHLFVNADGIMLGRGELWFDDKGLTAINPCIAQ